MPNYVHPYGSRTARIAILGEAPGKDEDRERQPFVGAAWRKLNSQLLAPNGLQRSDLYIDNVRPYRPEGNDLKRIPKEEMAAWGARLRNRLDELECNVIVPMGNHALRAVLQARVYDKRAKQHLVIGRARGFVFDYETPQRVVKVIPTYHPAYLFHDPSADGACLLDWKKIAAEARTPALRLREREHLIQPTLGDIEDFLADVLKLKEENGDCLSIDIETVRNPKPAIMCVGFSYDEKFSLTVPFDDGRWWRKRERRIAKSLVRQLCESPIAKVLQTGLYDRFWLALEGIEVRNHLWDPRQMNHCLLPQDHEHSLNYLASVHLPLMRYWKDETKSPETIGKYADDRDALWTYCGIDNTVQRELGRVLSHRLHRENLTKFYRENYVALFDPLLRVMLQGVRVDERSRASTYMRLRAACISIQDRCEVLAGRPLHGPKTLVPQRVMKYLYEDLGLPKQRVRKTGALTANELALRRLQIKFPDRCGSVVALFLEHRRKMQLAQFLRDERQDDDNRVRCSYSFAETLRCTSSKSPRGSGANNQNWDREIRRVALADTGRVFVEVDLSAAEDRVVKALCFLVTGERRYIEEARSLPHEFDPHATTAALIFGKPIEEINKFPERYTGKKTNHSSNYGVMGTTLAEAILKETESGLVYTPDECQGFIDTRLTEYDGIPRWHTALRRAVFTDGELVNSWGWRWTVEGRLLNSKEYGKFYAFLPQAEIGMLLNRCGLLPFHQTFGHDVADVNIQGHDSLLISVVPAQAWNVVSFLKRMLERTRTYRMPDIEKGVELALPVDAKVGLNWGERSAQNPQGMREWKRFPEREEFESEVASLSSHIKTYAEVAL